MGAGDDLRSLPLGAWRGPQSQAQLLRSSQDSDITVQGTTALCFPEHASSHLGKEKGLVLHFLVYFQTVLKNFSSCFPLVAHLRFTWWIMSAMTYQAKTGSTFYPVIIPCLPSLLVMTIWSFHKICYKCFQTSLLWPHPSKVFGHDFHWDNFPITRATIPLAFLLSFSLNQIVRFK